MCAAPLVGPQPTTCMATLMLGLARGQPPPPNLGNDHPLSVHSPQDHTIDNGHSHFIHDSFLKHSHPVWEQKCTTGA